MCFKYPGVKLESALPRLEDDIENLWSSARTAHTTTKQVIPRGRRKGREQL